MPLQNYSWKKALTSIREFFWPLLEPLEEQEPETPSQIEIQIYDDCLEQALDLKMRILDFEEDRRKSVESKAALFIGTISVACSLVVGASTFITANNPYTTPTKLLIFITFLFSLYSASTVWYAVKALQRGQYSALSMSDINFYSDKAQFTRRIISKLHDIIQDNQPAINQKVDYFTLAEEHYRRAIVVISIYAFALFACALTGGFKNVAVGSKKDQAVNSVKTLNTVPISATRRNIQKDSSRKDSVHLFSPAALLKDSQVKGLKKDGK